MRSSYPAQNQRSAMWRNCAGTALTRLSANMLKTAALYLESAAATRFLESVSAMISALTGSQRATRRVSDFCLFKRFSRRRKECAEFQGKLYADGFVIFLLKVMKSILDVHRKPETQKIFSALVIH